MTVVAVDESVAAPVLAAGAGRRCWPTKEPAACRDVDAVFGLEGGYRVHRNDDVGVVAPAEAADRDCRNSVATAPAP